MEISNQEFAQDGDVLVRGRQASKRVSPNERAPAGQHSATAATPERERRARMCVLPAAGVPDAQLSAPPKGRGRRAMLFATPIQGAPGGQISGSAGGGDGAHSGHANQSRTSPIIADQPDPMVSTEGVGDVGGAHMGDESQGCFSPTDVNYSDLSVLAGCVGRDEGAQSDRDFLKGTSPLVANLSDSSVSAEGTNGSEGAHRHDASHWVNSPLAAQASSAPDGDVGGDGGAHIGSAPQWLPSPAVAEESDPTVSVVGFGDDEGAHIAADLQKSASPLVVEIEQLWRMRQRWHRAEKSLILQGKAICRSWTDGDKDAADKLFAAAAKGAAADPHVEMALMPFLSAIDRFGTERAAIEKRLRQLARSHPLWLWVAEVKGFGPLNLAAIIGEAGEIGSYRNPSCLWKRMGLAVIDGGRQRRVANVDAAAIHGYSPQRRCVAYLLGDTLIKAGDGCPYRPVYAARREHTAVSHPDWSKGHSHSDAARYMVKRVLKDLWCRARAISSPAAA